MYSQREKMLKDKLSSMGYKITPSFNIIHLSQDDYNEIIVWYATQFPDKVLDFGLDKDFCKQLSESMFGGVPNADVVRLINSKVLLTAYKQVSDLIEDMT